MDARSRRRSRSRHRRTWGTKAKIGTLRQLFESEVDRVPARDECFFGSLITCYEWTCIRRPRLCSHDDEGRPRLAGLPPHTQTAAPGDDPACRSCSSLHLPQTVFGVSVRMIRDRGGVVADSPSPQHLHLFVRVDAGAKSGLNRLPPAFPQASQGLTINARART
jgi:hypothetical protein